jgi:hypothetical protein
MGLDVFSYVNIKIAEDKENYDFMAYVDHEDWNSRIKNLEKGELYNGDIVFSEVHYSYSSHSRFREILVKLVGRENLLNCEGKIIWDKLPNEMPFYEFIYFSDCEGCFDWESSNIVFLDFEKYNEKAKLEMNEYDYKCYKDWLKTFELAKNYGVVVFS